MKFAISLRVRLVRVTRDDSRHPSRNDAFGLRNPSRSNALAQLRSSDVARCGACRFTAHFRSFIRASLPRYLKWLRAGGTFVIRHSSALPTHLTNLPCPSAPPPPVVCVDGARLIGCERAFVGVASGAPANPPSLPPPPPYLEILLVV